VEIEYTSEKIVLSAILMPKTIYTKTM